MAKCNQLTPLPSKGLMAAEEFTIKYSTHHLLTHYWAKWLECDVNGSERNVQRKHHYHQTKPTCRVTYIHCGALISGTPATFCRNSILITVPNLITLSEITCVQAQTKGDDRRTIKSADFLGEIRTSSTAKFIADKIGRVTYKSRPIFCRSTKSAIFMVHLSSA